MHEESSRRPNIFISYAREDHVIAKRLYDDLKAAGAEPWLDAECLLPGQRFKTAISKAIRQADLFVALLSANSVNKRGYVQKETREALEILDTIPDEEIYVIPVRLDNCQPTHSKLAELNWVDLFPLYEAGLRKIMLLVRPSKIVASGSLQSAPLENPGRLEQTGWGIIFPSRCDPRRREAMAPLLEHRRQEAGGLDAKFYREFSGAAGYLPGEDAYQFLAKHGMGPGPADPRRMPYYLLLAGSPEEIPFEFQYHLGLQHRVGRIDFDLPEHYEDYARNVVACDVSPRRTKVATFFGPDHDKKTNFLVTKVLRPLADAAALERPDWSVKSAFANQATKERLSELLSKEPHPALLFIGAHGLYYSTGHARQRSHQGSIVCHEWPGSGHIPKDDHCFSAEDVPNEIDLRGLGIFLFGACSAGVPNRSDFHDQETTAPSPFVSALAKRCLGVPKGALAFIGHVDEIWMASVQWKTAGPQLQTLEAVVRTLMSGARVGEAMKYLSGRYAELAALAASLGSQESGNEDWVEIRRAMLDARNYILIGDPATRLVAQEV